MSYVLTVLWDALRTILLFSRQARPEGLLVLVVVGLPTLYFALRQLWVSVYRRIDAERAGLGRVHQKLQDLTASKQVLTKEDVDNLLDGLPDSATLTRALRAMWALRAGPSWQLEAIWSMAAQREANYLRGPRSSANVLMMAGLVGTVVALASMISVLQIPVPGPDTIDKLTATLSDAVPRLSTAFATTFWGLAGALLMAFLARQAAGKQNAWLQDLQQFALVYFAPAILPQHERVQLEEIGHVSKEIRRSLDQSRDFMRKFSSLLTGSAQQLEAVLKRATTEMGDSVTVLKNVATEVGNSASLLASSSTKLAEYHSDLHNAYSTMQQKFTELEGNLERLSQDQLKRVTELEEDRSRATERVVTKMDGISSDLAQTIAALNGAADRFTGSARELNGHFQAGFEQLRSGFAGALDDHKVVMYRVQTAIEQNTAATAALETSTRSLASTLIRNAYEDKRPQEPSPWNQGIRPPEGPTDLQPRELTRTGSSDGNSSTAGKPDPITIVHEDPRRPSPASWLDWRRLPWNRRKQL